MSTVDVGALVCATPTTRYPGGRTGTYAGYLAHSKVKEPPCEPCRLANCAASAKKRPTKEARRAEYLKNQDWYAARNLRAKHGLTVEEYAELLAAQNGVCAICGTTEPGGRGRFHVDHDHGCCPGEKSCRNCRRGLLCSKCNVGLGAFGDDIDRLTAAAAYLMTSREARR